MTLQSTPSVPRPVHHALRAQPVRASGPPRARIDSERYRSLQLPAAQSSLRAHNVDHGGVVCAAQAWLAARHTADSLTLELLRLSKEHHDGLQSRLDLSEYAVRQPVAGRLH